MSYPAMIAVPSVMEISPVNILNVVVFPAPESKVQSRSHTSMEHDDQMIITVKSY